MNVTFQGHSLQWKVIIFDPCARDQKSFPYNEAVSELQQWGGTFDSESSVINFVGRQTHIL